MNLKIHPTPKSILLAFATLVFCLPVSATLLVYEGFNYSLANDANLYGETVTGQGLAGDFSQVTGAGTQTFQFRTNGLTFGSNFLTTGGGAFISSSADPNARTFANASIAAATQVTSGTVYTAYLAQFSSLSTSTVGSGGIAAGFGIWVDGGSSTTALLNYAHRVASTTNNLRPGVGYGPNGGVTTSSAGPNLTSGTTYLTIARFENLGSGTGRAAHQFVFTQAAYDDWVDNGRIEADLDIYATWTTTHTGTETFDAMSRVFIAAYGRSSTEIESLVFDEFRMGTTLDAITQVPEPTTWALIAGLLVGGTALIRRRQTV